MMSRAHSGYKRLLLLFLVLALVAFLVSPELSRRPVRLIERPMTALIMPIQRAFFATGSAIRGFFADYIALRGVRRENQNLLVELGRLRGEVDRLSEERARAERLAELLAFRQTAGMTTQAANVIGRQPSNWYQTLLIDKGEEEGVRPGMGVMVPSGVVGRVTKVGSRFAQVLLLNDRNSAIGVLVQRTREQGVLEGIEEGTRFKYLSRFADVAEGDRVITSGVAGGFPKGVPVGSVSRVVRREDEMFLAVEVRPAVNLSNLEEVFVVSQDENESGAP